MSKTLCFFAFAFLICSVKALTEAEIAALPRIEIELVSPPGVHAHEQTVTAGPRVIVFKLYIEEKELVIDESDSTTVHALTYNGTVPGPLMVVHQDDYVEVTLVNPSTNTLLHNVDFHGSSGALGGGGLTKVNPGEQVTLRFRATRVGCFIYHCAPGGAMIPFHVVQGMAGTLMVLPRTGLKNHLSQPITYDRVYYIGENDFYVPKHTNGTYKTFASPLDSYYDVVEVMRGLVPSHIVFNGRVGALAGANAMTAAVGETVLFVHSQANRDSRPHLIGGHGDYVWEDGKFDNVPLVDMETWFIRGGSAGAMVYKFLQPGTYAYVNHNLIEAMLLGAAGHVVVTGAWDDDLMKQLSPPAPIP